MFLDYRLQKKSRYVSVQVIFDFEKVLEMDEVTSHLGRVYRFRRVEGPRLSSEKLQLSKV